MTTDPGKTRLIIAILTEAGILTQLARAWIEHAGPDGLTYAQFSVLMHLTRLQTRQTPLQLARAHQLPKTTMTHIVATLEKKGFVSMEPNPDDGRSKLVALTAAGEAAAQRTLDVVAPLAGQIGEGFDMEDLEATRARIAELRVEMDARRPE